MDRREFLQLSSMAALSLYSRHLQGLQISIGRQGPAKKVAILGAGISGLAAGLELVKAGHDVTILEAQLRPGGRVYTLRAPFSDGLYAEAGAGRIPITHTLTLDYVKRFKLELDPFFPQSGADVFLWRGQRQVLPHAMADALRDNIRYGAVVARIAQTPTNVEVTFANAGSHHTLVADHVICALPFTVLRGIEVHPQWSVNKAFAIENVYLSPVTRAYAQTKSRFWEADGRNGFATVDQPMEIWSPTYNQPGKRGIVMSYTYEDLAREYSAMSELAQVQRSLDLFEQIHPGMRQNFEGAATWSWLNHPFSKGAFMVTKPGQFRTVVPYLATPEGRIHFAGEHTSPWPGWIQCALHSGLRTAREIAAPS